MAKRGYESGGGKSEMDNIRDAEREIESDAATAGGKTEYGGKGSKTQSGESPVKTQEYDPDYGEIETTEDDSMRVAEEAVANAKESGQTSEIVDVE